MNVLPKLSFLKDRFYLAGGTGLALQLGHRDSIDFDFFTSDHFDTIALYKNLLQIFGQKNISKTLEEKDTLSVVLYEDIRMSFFYYSYALLEPLIKEEFLDIAAVADIGCMKLSAVVGRAVEKDYVDLYFILKNISLSALLAKAKEKMPDLDRNLILKSLIYFDDVKTEHIIFKPGFQVPFEQVKRFLAEEVKKAARG
jgi:hypothetical protein